MTTYTYPRPGVVVAHITAELTVWFFDGRLHREDGPAVERADGYCEYWIEGKRLDNNSLAAQAIKASNAQCQS
jgi:hypothetical protein